MHMAVPHSKNILWWLISASWFADAWKPQQPPLGRRSFLLRSPMKPAKTPWVSLASSPSSTVDVSIQSDDQSNDFLPLFSDNFEADNAGDFALSTAEEIQETAEESDVAPLSMTVETVQDAADVAEQERRVETKNEEQIRLRDDQLFLLAAILPSILAFFAWEELSQGMALFVDKYGAIGRSVDGGTFTINLLRPTITGVVVPVISIALATLVSTTVNVLRDRQVELRALINKEACELRLLRRAILGMFGTRQHASRRAKALALLSGYVQQLQDESEVGAIQSLEEIQLNGGIAVNELDRLAEMLHGVDGAAASRQGSVAMADSLIMSLNGHRSNRVALLLSTFPLVHWGVLAFLSFSICFSFLLNSNQQILQYLNSIQLRLLFGNIVGVFSGIASICYVLADPFRGSFSIAEAATQLGDLRLNLEKDVVVACIEEGEISSKTVHALLTGGSLSTKTSSIANAVDKAEWLSGVRISGKIAGTSSDGDELESGDRDNDKMERRYGLASTIYFHLLTGPLGSNARILGDVIAWVASFVNGWTRSASKRAKALATLVRRRFWASRSGPDTATT